MRASKKILCSVLASVFGLVSMNVHAADQPKPMTARLTAEVTPTSLPESTKDSRITAFDVAPDGSRLGVLYVTWPSRTSFGLSAAIWDIRSKAVVEHAPIGLEAVRAPSGPLVDDELIFTADEKYLLALGLGKVWILDANTCAVARSIDSPRSELGPPVRILLAGRSALAVTYRQGYNQFYVALFEIPTAKMIAGWQSSAFPQSFSPDGKLAVAPDAEHYNQGGVKNLLVMDARTGAGIKSIPVSFGFKKWESDAEKGSVTARFLDNDQVVVTPDNMTDHTGHHSGTSMVVINISESRVVREIMPKNFGPTGELAVSPDLGHFAVYSHNVSAVAKLSDGLWPDFHKPELMLFATNQTKPELVIPDLRGDGAVAHLRNMVLPRLSSNASVVAVAQLGAVKVFQAKE
jgi:hypothetical protein